MNDADPRDRLYQGKFQPQVLVHGLSYDLERPLLHCDNKTITAGDVTWELDTAKDKDLAEAAVKLNGKSAAVQARVIAQLNPGGGGGALKGKGTPVPISSAGGTQPHLVARDALVELGYSLGEAEMALARVDPELPPEERVREALKAA